MRMRWFGEPWGIGGRAPVCEEALRVSPPVGYPCAADGCGELIEGGDRGVITAAALDMPGVFSVRVRDGEWQTACAYHLDCFVGLVLPEARELLGPRKP